MFRSASLILAAVVLCASGGVGFAKCMRLGMSDVAFGKPAAIKSAREKLGDYAKKTAKKRGWAVGKGLSKSNEKLPWCKVYLKFGPFGTEYRCLVTATFCQK